MPFARGVDSRSQRDRRYHAQVGPVALRPVHQRRLAVLFLNNNKCPVGDVSPF